MTDWVLVGDVRVGQIIVWSQDEPRVIQSVDQRDGYVVLGYGGGWETYLLPHILVPIASSGTEAAA